MKTILVPTDFSETSINALDYAIEISEVMKAKLILFHAYHMPATQVEAQVVISWDKIEEDSMNALKEIEKNIYRKHGDQLNIECICSCGFAVEEIKFIAKEQNVDLIIMGMQGAGYLTEKLVGSNTTSLMGEIKCPLLAIDRHVKFRTIRKIVLACDYNEVNNKSVFDPIKEFIRSFKSHLSILNVVPELELAPSVDKAREGIKLDRFFDDVNHSFHCLESEDIVDGINGFVIQHKMDMVVMMPHKHSIIKNIFHRSATKHMAFHANVPLLVLHE